MFTPYEVYCTWLALNTHFKNMNPWKESYNFVVSNGRSTTTQQAFDKRSDRKIFNVAKFKDQRDVVMVYLSYVSVNRGTLPRIADLLDWKLSEERTIKKWLSKIESLQNTLKVDLMNVRNHSIKSLISPDGDTYPMLIKSWLNGKVSIETLVLLNEAYSIFTVWDKKYIDNSVYSDIYKEHRRLWTAYSFFVNIDVDKVKQVYEDWKLIK